MYEVDGFAVDVAGETTVGTNVLSFQVSSTHHEEEVLKRVVIKDGAQRQIATWHSGEDGAVTEKGIATHLAKPFGEYVESEYLV